MSGGQPPYDQLANARVGARQRAEGGDLTGARMMLEEAIAAGELRLGREHPRLAPLMVDLATIAKKLGNLTEARSQLRRAHGIVIASTGPEHATAVAIEARLAAVTHHLGEPSEGYDRHLIEAGTRTLGAEHPAVRAARQRLGDRVGPESVPTPTPPATQPPSPAGNQSGYHATTLDLPTEQTRYLPTDQVRYLPTDQVRYLPTDQARYLPTDQARYLPTDQARYLPTDQPGHLSSELGNTAAEPSHAPIGPGHTLPGPSYPATELEYASVDPCNIQTGPGYPSVEPGYPPLYEPSTVALGVYDRRGEADGVYVVAPMPGPDQEVGIWAPTPAPPTPAPPTPAPPTPAPPTAPPTAELPAPPPPRRGRSSELALMAGLFATLLLAIAVIVSQVVNPAGPDDGRDNASGASTSNRPVSPTPAAPSTVMLGTRPAPPPPTGVLPPTDLTLRDGGGSVALTWRDPAGGTVPFVLAGGRVGTTPRPLQTIPAGRTTSTIYGLNGTYDYCFTVIAVYSTTVTAPSIQACTHRFSTSR